MRGGVADQVLSAIDKVSRACVHAVAIVLIGADQDIVETIAVDIAGRGYAKAGGIFGSLASYPEAAIPQRDLVQINSGWQHRPAVYDIGCAAIEAPGIGVPSADNHIVIAVPVDIASRGDAPAGKVVCVLTDYLETAIAKRDVVKIDGVDLCCIAVNDIGCPAIRAAGIVVVGPDKDVVIAVAVDVAGRRTFRPLDLRNSRQLSEATVAKRDIIEIYRGDRRRLPVNDIGRTGIRPLNRYPGADNHVVIAIAVEVAGRGHAPTGTIYHVFARYSEATAAQRNIGEFDSCDPRCFAVNNIGSARIRATGIIAIGADNHSS